MGADPACHVDGQPMDVADQEVVTAGAVALVVTGWTVTTQIDAKVSDIVVAVGSDEAQHQGMRVIAWLAGCCVIVFMAVGLAVAFHLHAHWLGRPPLHFADADGDMEKDSL